jgi:ferredoxin
MATSPDEPGTKAMEGSLKSLTTTRGTNERKHGPRGFSRGARLVDVCLLVALLVPLLSAAAPALERFPPPEFSPGYQEPQMVSPPPRAAPREVLDVVVLLAALSASSYLALKARSRRGLFYLTIFSVAYFGFWRKGCVCSVGSLQNVALALFNSEVAVGLSVAAFFLLPLVFTLFFGRTFCAAVCPLGAIQDLVLLKPLSVPPWLERGLRLLAYLYLGLAVLFAATASAFIVCEYDPFVAFFRRTGSSGMLLLGAGVLALSLFVGRPYCRFLCPYGVILGLLSRVSKWNVSITPDTCVKCRLCEEVCPYGAIEGPADPGAMSPAQRARGARTLVVLAVLLPVLGILGAWIGAELGEPLSSMHWTVRLADRLQLEEGGKVQGVTEASTAFRGTGRPSAEAYIEAARVKSRFALGSALLGGFLGIACGAKLLQEAVRRRRTDYEVRRSTCLACGRCFLYCPQEHERLKAGGITVPPISVSSQL